MTSANRSSEPIAYEDDEALARLSEIADAFLIGERPIARRVDDSVARVGALRAQRCSAALAAYAPGAVARNSFRSADPRARRGSQKCNHACGCGAGVRQPAHRRSRLFRIARWPSSRPFATLWRCTRFNWDELLVVHDAHPGYVSTAFAQELAGLRKNRRAASPRAHRLGASRARRMEQARDRHQLRRHRLRRRRHDLGRRNFHRQRGARDLNAWRICVPPRSQAATPRRSIRCKRRQDFSRRFPTCRI